jgi:hypothetical protein
MVLTTATLYLIMAAHSRINRRRLFFNIRPLLEHGGAHPRRRRSPATRPTVNPHPIHAPDSVSMNT